MNRENLPEIALLYDFDKTLCTADIQEYTFIPTLEMEPKQFWSRTSTLSKESGMDPILCYMYMMLRLSREHDKPIRRENFCAHGKNVEFFPGVTEWFERIRKFGKENGVGVCHYIISSGLGEIIEGTPIAKEFREIFACRFHYDANGVADWPLSCVNYTGKTQYLFRINKGVLDLSDDKSVNEYMSHDERPVPFRRMIYIGDGFTDVPCMSLVRRNGGNSIAVFNEDDKTAKKLLTTDRVNYIARCDYSEGGDLDNIVKNLISLIALDDKMRGLTDVQKK